MFLKREKLKIFSIIDHLFLIFVKYVYFQAKIIVYKIRKNNKGAKLKNL